MNLRKFLAGFTVLILLYSCVTDARNKRENHEELLALYSEQQKQASFVACLDQFPAKKPIDINHIPAKMKPMALCSDHFAVLYSQASKTPIVVVERLTSKQLKDAKGEERSNQFYADPRLPKNARAELNDYRGVSMDRGHQSPAADAPNPRAMAQSFALSNMVPQDPTNNRKIWSKVESDVRKYAQRVGGNVFVFTGPIFDAGYKTVGKNKVWVPTRLFKLVYDESSQRAWAYVLPNGVTHIEKPMNYNTFVKTTGLQLLGNLSVSGTVNN
jgi:endonuclease G